MSINCKILVAYHKPAELLKSDVFLPIHVGREISGLKNKDGNLSEKDRLWLSNNLIGDDTGENISAKNRYYCELTAQYWAWKNLQADYIGFMHYRRHLSFNENKNFKENKWGLIENDYLDSEYIKKYCLNDISVKTLVNKYDIIVAKKWDVREAGSKSNYDHYKSSDKKLFIKDYDKALEILLEKYPEYSEAVKQYNASYFGYYTNIFIAKKEIYNEYCTMLFDVLFRLENEIDISGYTLEESRVYGYISEWLFGIFVTKKLLSGNYLIKELQRTIVHKIDKKVIRLCFSSDNNYVQHLGVTIASVLKNKKPNEAIECYIIDGGISKKNIKCLKKLNSISNFKLEFVKIDNSKFIYCPFNKPTHLSIAAYYRLILPSLFKDFDKILYLDSDMVVKTSLAELWDTDICEDYFAGVIDIIADKNKKRLKLKKYCNSGVLLFNLEKMRSDNIEDKFFKYIYRNSKKIVWHDQDVLNVVCQNNIRYIDEKWNAQTGEYNICYSSDTNKKAKYSYIVHFIGHKKPWDIKACQPFKNLYFKYLKLTPWKNYFYSWRLLRSLRRITRCLFSIKNENEYRVLSIMGIKIKSKNYDYIRLNHIISMEEGMHSIENQIKKLNSTLNKIHGSYTESFQRLEFGFRESTSANYSDINKRLNNIEMLIYQNLNKYGKEEISIIR